MATFTTTITAGKIVQELTFDGGVYRYICIRKGKKFKPVGECLGVQIAQRYMGERPIDCLLRHYILELMFMPNEHEIAGILAELQAIEDEYAKEKEAQNV